MDTQPIINTIVEQIKHIDGVSAIVLGGSRARGTHTPKSDIDLGIYYHPAHPLDLIALERVAAEIDDSHRMGLITPIGGWGPWINGGGWLTVQSQAVDFLYRDLSKVEGIIDDCLNGQVDMVYQPGHPHGFVSSIYLAEVAVCRPLWEADGRLSALKQRVIPYPQALQKALIQKFAWEIDFALGTGKKSIARQDVTYAAGCCFRAAACMLQVLFALNEEYWLNEKGALLIADKFQLRPVNLKERIEEAFALLSADGGSIEKTITMLENVNQEIRVLLA
jgi:predicted nucleotidyltransferase